MHQTAQQAYESLLTSAKQNNLPLALITRMQDDILHAFRHSSFIQRIALQYAPYFVDMLPSLQCVQTQLNISHYQFENIHTELTLALESSQHETESLNIIRRYRHLHMLKIAWHDLHHQQSIESSLLATSMLANLLINAALDDSHNALVKRFGEPENKQRLVIMAMGKLGGNELNFSSDIDLIFAYPCQGETQGGRKSIEHQVFFTKLAQRFIKALDYVNEHGRVFRVDMRLRPLGDSGPLVLPFSAFESYYLEQGRQWERFAMQKMRIVNDTPYNDELLAIVKPFVYRKYLDYTTLESIREMKHLIAKEVRRKQITQNIKLGKGGIREVEFFIQSLQLIHAGRHPQCQVQSILKAMQALEDEGLLAADIHQSLKQNYLYLRQVEHYLQIFNDEQTQTLPVSDINQQRLCSLLQVDSIGDYQNLIDQCMQGINVHFNSLVADANASEECNTEVSQVFEDLWLLPLTLEEAVAHLNSEQTVTHIDDLYEHLELYKRKIERSGVSQRGLKSINRLMPLILQEFEVDHGGFNNEQVAGVFNILNTISGRATYIDLLLEHPEVRQRLYLLCKKSPWISEQIAQYPLLLDELLHPQYLSSQTMSLEQWKSEYADELRQHMLRVDLDDIESVMDRLREFKHTNQLRIAAADITGNLPINCVSDKLTVLAEAILDQVIEYAWQQVTLLYGEPQGNRIDSKNIAVIAYGKFGGIELSYDSDLDIVFLHAADMSQNTTDTGTRKVLSNQEFYIKLVQRICHLCTTKTYNGVLYDIDLRLRPSGNSGLLVSHIDSFLAYQNNKAWTWEHQALVRTRPICAPEHLHKQFLHIKQTIIGKEREPKMLRQEVHKMRIKMRDHLLKSLNTKIDLKQARGGIVDIEFMVQYWVLANASKHINICEWSDNLRLLRALSNTNVIDATTAANISEAYLRMRHITHSLQLAKHKYAQNNDELSQQMALISALYTNLFEQDTIT
ncbi:MAG: bifunctional [glutamate--ammonia ligase]-adenylyl-L-tyrosine phosphorylase/[glutamate--ammonia-ligase] adenylyltransferase [Glaciecola sp.]